MSTGDDADGRASRARDGAALRGKKVLITRPLEDATAFAERLRAQGAEPLIAPAIAIAPPDDVAAARRAARDAASYDWVAFTSRHGVDAFFAQSAGSAANLHSARVAAIGERTAERLRDHGVVADFVPAEFVGEAFAAGLLERTQPHARILLFRAQDARAVLPVALREAGRTVDDVAAYKTVVAMTGTELRRNAAEADIWTFASAGAVRSFVSNVPDCVALAARKVVACIGPVAADAARNAGLRVDAIARAFTVTGLIEAITELAVAPETA